MQYMGSKNKIAKEILPIILKDRKPDQYFIDLFCGCCNLIDKVDGNRIGNDKHYHLISMWKALQKGWIPPREVTKEYYYEVKRNQQILAPELVGFVGFICSFGGKWWGGYAANTKGDNYADRGARVLLKQIKNLPEKEVIFLNLDYTDMSFPADSIIYCDIPYKGTTGYKDGFDHEKFWNWARTKSKEGYSVFVSEYTAPDDFECLKEIKHKTILDKNSQDVRIERLFKLKMS